MKTFAEFAPTMMTGIVTAVDENSMRVKVALPDMENMTSGWLQVGARKTLKDKDYWLPDIEEQVLVLLDAHGEDGYVICALYSSADKVPIISRDRWMRKFADGSTISYDRAASTLELDCVGTVTVKAADAVTVETNTIATIDAPETLVTGNLTVSKKLTYQGGMAGSGGNGSSIEGDINVTGNVGVNGNVNATGSVMDGAGNSNHHSH